MGQHIKLDCYTDTLCIWAYTSQICLDELKKTFAESLTIEHHFISVFGMAKKHIDHSWNEKGGLPAFADHVLNVSAQFPHVTVHPDIWRRNTPASSLNSHLFIKAVQILEQAGRLGGVPGNAPHAITEDLIWRVRKAFFEGVQDIGRWDVLFALGEQMNIPLPEIEELLKNGEAAAALSEDLDKKDSEKLAGSPTFILNSGRQKLYGNVGYRVLSANITELLEKSSTDASWC